MGKVKQIEIKNRTYYFYNDIINIEEFNSSLLKIDKKSYKDIDIYYIGYITIKKIGGCENIYSVNPLYLIIGEVDGHIEEKNGSKYLVFDSTDENKEVLKRYAELWIGIKNETEIINGGKKREYGKDFMKTKFDTDDNIPLNKQLKLYMLTIIVRFVFEKDGELYPQAFLDDALYELEKCYSMKKLMLQKELTLIKEVHQKNVSFVIIGTSKMLDLNLNHMSVINTTMF